MKIAIVALYLNTKGGTQRQALSIARSMKKLGHEVTVYSLIADYDRCYGAQMREVDIKLAPFSPHPDGGNLLIRKIRRKKNVARNVLGLARLIPHDVDVINCQDDESYKAARYFRELNRNARVSISWTMNDPPISYRPKPTFLMDAARKIFNVFELFYERRFVAALDRIFVLDKRNQELVRSYYAKDSIIIGSAIDYDYFYNPPHALDTLRPIRILGLGIFAPYRRFEDIIEATAILRDQGVPATATIMGDREADGGYARQLDALVLVRSVGDRVKFAGRVSEQELLGGHRTHDVFVFPNHMQTFGLAPGEAMAAGLPVIISRTAGFSEFVHDGEDAFVVEPLSPNQIAEKIKEFVNNPELYVKIAKAGQEFIKREMAWERRAKDMLEAHASVTVQ